MSDDQRPGSDGVPRRLHVGQWRLCVVISEDLCTGGDWWPVAVALAGLGPGKAGVDCIQLREKSVGDGSLLQRATRLVALCRPRGVSVVVNDRPDIALLAGADGVHLGQGDIPCVQARRLVGGRMIIGVSTSSLDQARRALDDGADYCGVGPMFPTTTADKPVIAGPAYLREYVAWGRLPHLAIGGINAGNAATLVQAGASGVAVSRAVCAADDPASAAGALSQIVAR